MNETKVQEVVPYDRSALKPLPPTIVAILNDHRLDRLLTAYAVAAEACRLQREADSLQLQTRPEMLAWLVVEAK